MPRDRIISTTFYLSLIVLVIAAGLLVFMLPAGTGSLILQFNPQQSISFLGNKAMAIAVVVVFIIMTAMNIFLSREVYYRERFLSYLIAFATFAISIFCLVAAGVIVAAN